LIRRFNADNRNFLVLSPGAPADHRLLDISHESLLRQWKSLAAWVDEEAESARVYKRPGGERGTARRRQSRFLPRSRPPGGPGLAEAATAQCRMGRSLSSSI
jgi:hypothetical protein